MNAAIEDPITNAGLKFPDIVYLHENIAVISKMAKSIIVLLIAPAIVIVLPLAAIGSLANTFSPSVGLDVLVIFIFYCFLNFTQRYEKNICPMFPTIKFKNLLCWSYS